MITLEGILTLVKDKELIGSYKKFAKRECVLRLSEGKHEEILIEFHQDDCSMLNNFAEGEQVSIDVNIRGRKWKNADGVDKYFVSLQAWRISLTNP